MSNPHSQVNNIQHLGAKAYHDALRAINNKIRVYKVIKMKMIQQLKKLQHPNKSTLQSIRNSLKKSPRRSTNKSPKK